MWPRESYLLGAYLEDGFLAFMQLRVKRTHTKLVSDIAEADSMMGLDVGHKGGFLVTKVVEDVWMLKRV